MSDFAHRWQPASDNARAPITNKPVRAAPVAHIRALQKIDQDRDLLEEISEIFPLPGKNVE